MDAALAAAGEQVRAVAIADDVTFVGPADGRLASVATGVFAREAKKAGLVFRGSKSKLLNFSQAQLHSSALNLARGHGIPIIVGATDILGTPMGPEGDAVQQIALNKISRGDSFFKALPHPLMPRAIADKLLRLAGTPRQVYLCRVGFPGEYSQALEAFDQQVELAGALLLGDAGRQASRSRTS